MTPEAQKQGPSYGFQDKVGEVGDPGHSCTPTHRHLVLVVLISASVAPFCSTSVLMLILFLILLSHGQVEPTATLNHFP